jgi:hypothetical protein
VLSATSVERSELEHIIGALWELAELARLPWRAWTEEDAAIRRARARRRKLKQQLVRLAFVAIACCSSRSYVGDAGDRRCLVARST